MANKIIPSIILIFSMAMAFSQQDASPAKKSEQRLEWVYDENVLSYKVEVKSSSGGDSLFFTTEKNFVDVALSAGTYRYRVYAYDMLGRESSVSNWTFFEVEKVVEPQIVSVQNEVDLIRDEPKKKSIFKKNSKTQPASETTNQLVQIDTEIKNVTNDSKVEFINTETGEIVQGNIVVRGVQINSDKLTPGSWQIKITNPGGVTTESEVPFTVRSVSSSDVAKATAPSAPATAQKEPVPAKDDEKTSEKSVPSGDGDNVQEDSQKDSREDFREEPEKTQEDLAQTEASSRDDFSFNSGMSESELAALTDEERLATRKKELVYAKIALRDEKRRYRKLHPYIPVEANLLFGAGYAFAPYTESLARPRFNECFYPTDLNARFSAFSPLKNKMRYGLEMRASVTVLDAYNKSPYFIGPILYVPRHKGSYRVQSTTFTTMCLNFVWQRRLFNDHMFFSIKGGGGLCAQKRDLIDMFTSTSSHTKGFQSFYKGSLGTFSPALSGGASLYINPLKYMAIEIGCDFTHTFAPSCAAGLLTPFVSMGFHF